MGATTYASLMFKSGKRLKKSFFDHERRGCFEFAGNGFSGFCYNEINLGAGRCPEKTAHQPGGNAMQDVTPCFSLGVRSLSIQVNHVQGKPIFKKLNRSLAPSP
jgi:hypothetical protein